MTESVAPSLAFAYVTAQEEMITNVGLDKELKTKIKLKCLPLHPNSSWTKEYGYSGLKIFHALNNLCISYFFNEGKKDRFGRPILSSNIVIIPKP